MKQYLERKNVTSPCLLSAEANVAVNEETDTEEFGLDDCAFLTAKQPQSYNDVSISDTLTLMLERRTPDREPRVRSSAGSVCCFLEQETFTPQKVLVTPRNRWLRLNMTEKLFKGTLNHNQNKKKSCLRPLELSDHLSSTTSLKPPDDFYYYFSLN